MSAECSIKVKYIGKYYYKLVHGKYLTKDNIIINNQYFLVISLMVNHKGI